MGQLENATKEGKFLILYFLTLKYRIDSKVSMIQGLSACSSRGTTIESKIQINWMVIKRA